MAEFLDEQAMAGVEELAKRPYVKPQKAPAPLPDAALPTTSIGSALAAIPVTNARVNALDERIKVLEALLREAGLLI